MFNSAFSVPPVSETERISAACAHYGSCGGCQMQHIAYGRQLRAKGDWLRALFADGLSPEAISDPLASPKIWNYRRRIQVKAGPGGTVGYFAPGSHRVVPVESCAIADSALNEALPQVRALAQADLRDPRRPALLGYEMTLQKNGEVEIVRQGAERTFLQVNEGANDLLKTWLRQALEQVSPQSVLELFAGSGNLTLALAQGISRWRAVENHPEAVAQGRQETTERQLEVEWICEESGKELNRLLKKREKWEVVLLDPPRGGAAHCIPPLLKLKPRWIFYVSCHPPSLHRDTLKLIQGG